MTDATTPEQPRTAAVADVLMWMNSVARTSEAYLTGKRLLDAAILAIEAQARPAVASEGLRVYEQLARWINHDRDCMGRFGGDNKCVCGLNDAHAALAIEAQARPAVASEGLREAAKEMLAHIDAYDDAMGHGYCAKQEEDGYLNSCTCGYDEMMERWRAALANEPLASEGLRTALARATRQIHSGLPVGHKRGSWIGCPHHWCSQARAALASDTERSVGTLDSEGVNKIDPERLARALVWAEKMGYLALMGTDQRVDAKGYPLRNDYTGTDREVAEALLVALAVQPVAYDAERQGES